MKVAVHLLQLYKGLTKYLTTGICCIFSDLSTISHSVPGSYEQQLPHVYLFKPQSHPVTYCFVSDNDKPNVTTSNGSPQEGVDNVDLTCVSATSDVISSYEWRKGNVTIEKATDQKYQIPGNAKANSGSYQCKVITDTVPPSPLSDALSVTFLCKLCLSPLRFNN